jgi:hypothetical protein
VGKTFRRAQLIPINQECIWPDETKLHLFYRFYSFIEGKANDFSFLLIYFSGFLIQSMMSSAAITVG